MWLRKTPRFVAWRSVDIFKPIRRQNFTSPRRCLQSTWNGKDHAARRLRNVLEHPPRSPAPGSSKAQNPPFLLAQTFPSASPFVPGPGYSSGSAPPTPVTGGTSRIQLRCQLSRWIRAAVVSQRAAAARHELHVRGRLCRIARPSTRGIRRCQSGTGPARRDQPECQPALLQRQSESSAAWRSCTAAARSSTTRFRHDSFGALLPTGSRLRRRTPAGKAIDLAIRHRWLHDVPQLVRPRATTGDRQTTTSPTCSRRPEYTLPLARNHCLATGSSPVCSSRDPVTRSPCLQSQNPLSTMSAAFPGQLYRPDRIGSGSARESPPSIDGSTPRHSWPPRSAPATFGNSRAQHSARTWSVHD